MGRKKRTDMPTLNDVAKKAGLSVAAVSCALRGKGRLSASTRLRVHQVAARMGYIPERHLQVVRSEDEAQSSMDTTVGVLVPDLSNSYYAQLVTQVLEYLYKQGSDALVGSCAENIDRHMSLMRCCAQQSFDGTIVVPQGYTSEEFELLTRDQRPLVFLDRRLAMVQEISAVVSDPEPGMRNAMEHAIELRHQQIAFIGHPSLESHTINEREALYFRLFDELIDPFWKPEVHETDGSLDAMRAIMGSSKATCYIVGYGPDAVTAVQMLRELGLSVGGDKSLISFDDVPLFSLMTPQISAISSQTDLMAREAVAVLLRELKDPHAEHKLTRIPSVYVARESVGPRPW